MAFFIFKKLDGKWVRKGPDRDGAGVMNEFYRRLGRRRNSEPLLSNVLTLKKKKLRLFSTF